MSSSTKRKREESTEETSNEKINIFKGNSLSLVEKWASESKEGEYMFDAVITSPPYNIGKDDPKDKDDIIKVVSRGDPEHKPKYIELACGCEEKKDKAYYAHFKDNEDPKIYVQDKVKYFKAFEKIVKNLVIWNQSYGVNNGYLPTLTVAEIIKETEWTLIDTICWNKRTATPIQNALRRASEIIYIFAKKEGNLKKDDDNYRYSKGKYEINKIINKYKKEEDDEKNIYQNYIETVPTSIKKSETNLTTKVQEAGCGTQTAIFPEELIEKILNIYMKDDWKTILDPYAGTGTTGFASLKKGLNFTGIEMDHCCCRLMANEFHKFPSTKVFLNENLHIPDEKIDVDINIRKLCKMLKDSKEIFFKEGDKVCVETEKSMHSVSANIVEVIKETQDYKVLYCDKKYNEDEDEKGNVVYIPQTINQSVLLTEKALKTNYNLLFKNNKEGISSILANLKKPDISPIAKRLKTTKDGRKKSSRKKSSRKKSSKRKSNK